MFDGDTIRRIRHSVSKGKLIEPFRAAEVNRLLGIDWANTFLPKHCVLATAYTTEHFVRVGRGLYRLKDRPS
jgi:hypothetical protein